MSRIIDNDMLSVSRGNASKLYVYINAAWVLQHYYSGVDDAWSTIIDMRVIKYDRKGTINIHQARHWLYSKEFFQQSLSKSI